MASKKDNKYMEKDLQQLKQLIPGMKKNNASQVINYEIKQQLSYIAIHLVCHLIRIRVKSYVVLFLNF